MSELDYNEIKQGDLVDFGGYGNFYVCNPNYSAVSFWITKEKENRANKYASGWSIRKHDAKSIIESFKED